MNVLLHPASAGWEVFTCEWGCRAVFFLVYSSLSGVCWELVRDWLDTSYLFSEA